MVVSALVCDMNLSQIYIISSYLNRSVGQLGTSQVALVVKNPSANAEGARDVVSIPGSGRSPGGGQ